MTTDVANVSSIKVAWGLCWAAFWTGFPLKLIAAVLLLAMQVPPWEGAGLTALLIVSIPVDLWALGLTARTYFLERHGLELEGAIGFALWWQGALIGVAFLAAAYFAGGAAVSIGKQIAASIIGGIKKVFPGFSIAEQITLELLLWSIPVAAVLGILALIALKIYGWRIKATVNSAGRPTAAPLAERVRRWDYARVPRDPALVLTSFAAVIVLITIVFWLFLPVTTPHPSEDYKVQVKKPVKHLKPEDMLKQTEMSLAKADAVLHSLEQEKGKEKKKATKPEQKGK
jgi:hypothetical protein